MAGHHHHGRRRGRLGRSDRLRIHHGKLLIRRIQGDDQPLGINEHLAHPADWQALTELISRPNTHR